MRQLHIIGTQHGREKGSRIMTTVMDERLVDDFYKRFKDLLLDPATILIPEGFASRFCVRHLKNPKSTWYKKINQDIFGKPLPTNCSIRLVDTRKISMNKKLNHLAEVIADVSGARINNGTFELPTAKNLRVHPWMQKHFASYSDLLVGYANKIEGDVVSFLSQDEYRDSNIIVIVGHHHLKPLQDSNLQGAVFHSFLIKDNEKDSAAEPSEHDKVLGIIISNLMCNGQFWISLEKIMES